MTLDPSSILSNLPFFALMSPLLLFWGQAREFLSRIIRIFIVEVQVSSYAGTSLAFYLHAKGRQMPSNMSKYASTHEYILRHRSHRAVLLAINSLLKNQIYWIKDTLVSLSDKRGEPVATGSTQTHESLYSMRFLRGTLDHEKLICEAIQWRESHKEIALNARFAIQRYVGRAQEPMTVMGRAETSKPSGGGNWGSPGLDSAYSLEHNRIVNYARDDIGYAKRDFFYVFNSQTKALHDDVARWLKSKDWYESRGLLHRRGALLHGQPGSGKSAAIRKIAQELDLPLFLFELNTMADHEFLNYWDEARGNSPCIIVFEDIDCSFKGRENISKSGKLSFECLLNCISGVQPAEGVYLFVTTNRLDYLDPALGIPDKRGVSTRPGRLDTCFQIDQITEGEKRAIGNHFLKEHPAEIERLVTESNGCTAAQFSDACSQRALELYWRTAT